MLLFLDYNIPLKLYRYLHDIIIEYTHMETVYHDIFIIDMHIIASQGVSELFYSKDCIKYQKLLVDQKCIKNSYNFLNMVNIFLSYKIY